MWKKYETRFVIEEFLSAGITTWFQLFTKLTFHLFAAYVLGAQFTHDVQAICWRIVFSLSGLTSAEACRVLFSLLSKVHEPQISLEWGLLLAQCIPGTK
jgi:hypothetical protein